MPRVKTCRTVVAGAKFEAHLNVSSKGVFSIKRPGTPDDWNGYSMDIAGDVADKVEAEWVKAIRDLSQRTRKERKVILVRFDSTLREDGKKNFFTSEDTMLVLECAIVCEITTTQGGKVTVIYEEHEEYSGFHGKQQPFPSRIQLRHHYCNHPGEDCMAVEWSQATEDTLLRACKGIQAVVDMLNGVLASPKSLLAAHSKLAMLPWESKK